MKAVILTIIIALFYAFALALAKAAGMASREEERWAEREQADKDDH